MNAPGRSANGHRRRTIRARVLATENTCALCGEPVDKTLGFMPGRHSTRCANPECTGCVRDPMSPEVDEIIPFSLGGSPTARANTQLAHRLSICNQRKGNGTRNRVLPPLTEVMTSREW